MKNHETLKLPFNEDANWELKSKLVVFYLGGLKCQHTTSNPDLWKNRKKMRLIPDGSEAVTDWKALLGLHFCKSQFSRM